MENNRILIIDDNEDLRALLEFILKREGYSIAHAVNGDDALKLIGGQDMPVLILLDIIMPYRDGFEILEAIKADDEWKKIPVLMLTARHEQNKMERAYKMGIDNYVVKPFKPDDLLQHIRQTLGEPS